MFPTLNKQSGVLSYEEILNNVAHINRDGEYMIVCIEFRENNIQYCNYTKV